MTCSSNGTFATTAANFILASDVSSVASRSEYISHWERSRSAPTDVCTPSWMMNMYSLLEDNSDLTREQVEQNFDGNLCRCTGWRPILDALREFASGGSCCGKDTSIPKPLDMPDHVQDHCIFSDPLTDEEYRPVTMHQLGTTRHRAESAKKKVFFMSVQQRQVLSSISSKPFVQRTLCSLI